MIIQFNHRIMIFTKLNAVEVSSSPTVDGVVDGLCADVPALVVPLGETNKPPNDPSHFWPIGEISGSPYNTGGCMTKCHMYYPTDTDPHVSSHGIVDDAWLVSGRADMWHSKDARGTAYTSATGTNLTINPATFEVTGGTFSMIGYADAMTLTQTEIDAGECVGDATTGVSDDDIQFTDFSKEYLFNIAEFDNSRHGYEHRTSESYFLKFWE